MRGARTAAQAKINLWLKVGARDATGYHEIGTIFHRIELADEVVVRAGGSVRSIDCAGPMLPAGGLGPPENNLAFRAALAFAERAGWPRGFAIEITKYIPVGGGLGGGSADAAATLRALNAVTDRPLEPAVLRDIAITLGADVAFLATEHVAAVAGGRGDQLMPFESLPVREVMLLVSPVAIGTADAYRWLDDSRPAPEPRTLTEHVSLRMLQRWDLMAAFSENDFEPVVEARYPVIRSGRERLRDAGALISRLSGSGSTVFGVFEGAAVQPTGLGAGVRTIATRTSARVVQVEALE